MRKIIVILLATVLLLTACGKKAEKPNESEPTQSESETMSTESKTAPTESETTPRESDTIPSESESDTVQATELDHHIEMYDENDVVYAKELTPVKHVENPTYRIEGYYATPSEAFAGYPIIHCMETSLKSHGIKTQHRAFSSWHPCFLWMRNFCLMTSLKITVEIKTRYRIEQTRRENI